MRLSQGRRRVRRSANALLSNTDRIFGIVLKSLDDPAYKAYNPTVVESSWYSWWEKEGFFEPEFGPDGNPKPEGLFVIPAPPPNVTGALHIGHALTIAIQDTMIRW